MSIYALWNNKGGVGKSYLTFQIAAEYARTHPNQNVLVIDMCPQANASSMLLGGMVRGEDALNALSSADPRLTIAGYIRERIASPYQNPRIGARYLHRISDHNGMIPSNLHLVVGDEELEMLASRVAGAARPGPDDAWARASMDSRSDQRRSPEVEHRQDHCVHRLQPQLRHLHRTGIGCVRTAVDSLFRGRIVPSSRPHSVVASLRYDAASRRRTIGIRPLVGTVPSTPSRNLLLHR